MSYKLQILHDSEAAEFTITEIKAQVQAKIERFDLSDLVVCLPSKGDDGDLIELEKIDGVTEATFGTLNYPFGMGGHKGWGIEVHLDSSIVPLVRCDEDSYLSATINTDVWLESVLGEPDAGLQGAFDGFVEASEVGEYEGIYDFISAMGWTEATADNTYNHENDLDGTIDFVVATRDGSEEWYYSSGAVIFLRRHHGGDVRGNYGPVEVYKLNEDDAHSFLRPVVSWYFTNILDPEGNAVPDSDTWKYDEKYQEGYTSNPTYTLQEELECFERIEGSNSVRLTMKDGTQATAHPIVCGL